MREREQIYRNMHSTPAGKEKQGGNHFESMNTIMAESNIEF